MSPNSPSSASAPEDHEAEVLAYRNPHAMFEAFQRFEQDWADWLDASMSVREDRPATFPPLFRSRWALAWWMRTATDDEVLSLMRTLERHPADLDHEAQALPPRPELVDVLGSARAKAAASLSPEAVREAGFPRVCNESA